MNLWFYWLILITATVMMAAFNMKSLPLLIMLLTIVKLLTISEIFMEMKHAPTLWRSGMQGYAVILPMTCFFIINF
jgi:cytochrome c oxidase subunit 4